MSSKDNFFVRLLKKLFPSQEDDQETRFFKIIVYTILGSITVITFVAVSLFFLYIQGADRTIVPDVVGQKLENAIITLQERELNARLQVRHSSEPSEKGKIIAQDPPEGSLVKAGRQISVIMSKGTIIDKVENYINQNIEDVETHLQTLFVSQKPLLKIKNIAYISNDAPVGTIIEQKPLPDTDITEPIDLEFVVSSGPDSQKISVKNYLGLFYTAVIDSVTKDNVPFAFSIREKKTSEAAGIIVSQEPRPGTEVSFGETVTFVMTQPAQIDEDLVFNIFEYTLPDYPIFTDLKLEVLKVTGRKEVLLEMKHPGGEFKYPYTQAIGDVLILTVFDKEITRQNVTEWIPPEDENETESDDSDS